MNKVFFILIIIASSCSSTPSLSREWGPWKRAGVAQEKMVWKFCKKDLHGPAHDKKGMCYITQECRYRKSVFGNTKSECRDALKVCKWGDIPCMLNNNIFNSDIVHKGN